MKIYVINLKGSTKRRKAMAMQLQQLKVDFEFFDAVVGAELTDEQISKYFDREFFENRQSYYSLGMAGCTLSHYFLYQKIVKDNVPRALILEDDVIINPNLKSIMKDVEHMLRPDEVIMLFYQSFSPIRASFSQILPRTTGYNLYNVNPSNKMLSTAGYFLTNQVAEKLSKGLCPISTAPDDWEKFCVRELVNHLRIVYPFVLTSSYSATTINSKFSNSSRIAKILKYVDEHQVFPIFQILKKRREKRLSSMRNVLIIK